MSKRGPEGVAEGITKARGTRPLILAILTVSTLNVICHSAPASPKTDPQREHTLAVPVAIGIATSSECQRSRPYGEQGPGRLSCAESRHSAVSTREHQSRRASCR